MDGFDGSDAKTACCRTEDAAVSIGGARRTVVQTYQTYKASFCREVRTQLVVCSCRWEHSYIDTLGIHKPDDEVVRLVSNCLPLEACDAEQRTGILRYGILLSEMGEIVRTPYANPKAKALEDSILAALVLATATPLVDTHVLSVGEIVQNNTGGERCRGAG